LIPTEPPNRSDAWFLTLSRTVEGDRIRWRAAGRLGAAGGNVLRETLLSSDFAGRLVLDLERVDYVSGAGIEAIEAIAKAAHDGGGGLELINVTGPVQIAFALAGPLAHAVINTSANGQPGVRYPLQEAR
jgi:anti-anti-sigma regulatory factor